MFFLFSLVAWPFVAVAPELARPSQALIPEALVEPIVEVRFPFVPESRLTLNHLISRTPAMIRTNARRQLSEPVRRLMGTLELIHAAWKDGETQRAGMLAKEFEFLLSHDMSRSEDQADFPATVAALLLDAMRTEPTIWATQPKDIFEACIFARLKESLVEKIQHFVAAHTVVFDMPKAHRFIQGRFDPKQRFVEKSFWKKPTARSDKELRVAGVRMVVASVDRLYWILHTLPGPAPVWQCLFPSIREKVIAAASDALNRYELEAFTLGKTPAFIAHAA